MLKESHVLLGNYLIDHFADAVQRRHKKLFLWGCVEPDYNYLTYLKGSLKNLPLRGHHYPNGKSRISQLAGRLKKNRRRNGLNFYRLGKLTHYVSDAFTHAHNPGFGGRVKGHRSYEIKLHSHFQKGLRETGFSPYPGNPGSAEAFFFELHRQYAHTAAGLSADLDYIIKVTASVFRMLVPEADGAPVRSPKLLLDCLYGILRRGEREDGAAPAYSGQLV